MLAIALSLMLIAAAACFGLSRLLPTRRLGQGAAAACGLSGLLLAAAPGAGADLSALGGFSVGDAAFELAGRLGPGELALALALLWCGALALLALAAAVAPQVRAFGAIFGWAILGLAAALLSLAAPPLSLITPLAWSAGALACYGALRASGALAQSHAMPRGLALGLLASSLLLGGLLGARPALARAELPPAGVALSLLLAVLAMAGAAPLAMARDEAVLAPAPLGGLIYGLVGPTLALGFLLRLVPALPALPAAWATALAGVGALGGLACAGGALGEERLRPVLGWSAGAQIGAVLLAAGLAGPLAALAGPALLICLMLATTAGAAAAVDMERNNGGDDFASTQPGPRLALAGAIWAAAAAAALGLPPLAGFWARRWLLEAVLAQMPWALPLLLSAGALLALALLAPLARFWPASGPRSPAAGRIDPLAGALALAPLLIAGAAPQLAWAGWLGQLPLPPDSLPVAPAEQAAALAIGLAAALLAIGLARAPGGRQIARAPEEDPTQLAPEALGASLRPLAWLARPDALLRAIWHGLGRVGEGLGFLMAIFEQRYYLLGIIAALLTIMLLMAQ
jgi:formate hydrogenlyase subunit 3/multisubunit Na+/H+ antiporter MnhD subunit